MLAELKEYATEVDVDFVRKAVRAIGRCAIKVEVSGHHRALSPGFVCQILFSNLSYCSKIFIQMNANDNLPLVRHSFIHKVALLLKTL